MLARFPACFANSIVISSAFLCLIGVPSNSLS